MKRTGKGKSAGPRARVPDSADGDGEGGTDPSGHRVNGKAGAAPHAEEVSRARAIDSESTALLPRNLEIQHRISEVEQMLASGRGPRQVSKLCMERWGVRRRAADRYVRAVYLLWSVETRSGDRESKRAQLRAMLMNNYRHAHEQFKPDIRAANEAVELLGRLDALIDPDEKGDSLPETAEQVEEAMLKHYGMDKLEPGQTMVLEHAPDDAV